MGLVLDMVFCPGFRLCGGGYFCNLSSVFIAVGASEAGEVRDID